MVLYVAKTVLSSTTKPVYISDAPLLRNMLVKTIPRAPVILVLLDVATLLVVTMSM